MVCDSTCATSAPGVVAAGDIARWPNNLFGETMRVEHWSNAVEQGAAAAKRLLAGPGEAVDFTPVPYFWSDQYDTKIQFLGRCCPTDEVRVVDGSIEERRFVALFGRDGRLVGALAFNRPRLLMGYRKLLAAKTSFEDALAHAQASVSDRRRRGAGGTLRRTGGPARRRDPARRGGTAHRRPRPSRTRRRRPSWSGSTSWPPAARSRRSTGWPITSSTSWASGATPSSTRTPTTPTSTRWCGSGSGIPITLSVLTMEVGRRLGVALDGVGMPGHFLVRHRADPDTFLDPFGGGRRLDVAGCQAIFTALGGTDWAGLVSSSRSAPGRSSPACCSTFRPVPARPICGRRPGCWSCASPFPALPVAERLGLARALGSLGRFGSAAAANWTGWPPSSRPRRR